VDGKNQQDEQAKATEMIVGVTQGSKTPENRVGLTPPFTLALADKGYRQALVDDPHPRNGLNVHFGTITHRAIAQDLGYAYPPAVKAIAA
jgi:alanine dehydrogenase